MEELLLGLAKDSPWIAMCGYLLYRVLASADRTLEVCQSGANTARSAADSNSSLAASIESLERSVGTMQTTVARAETAILDVKGIVTEMRVEARARPS